MAISNMALASLAILKTNWDKLGRDYMENFMPFLSEALSSSAEDVVSLPKLQEEIKIQFGLHFPLNPLRQLLQRAAKRGIVKQEHGVFTRNRDVPSTPNFSSIKQTAISSQEMLVRKLCEYVRTIHNTEWSVEDAAAGLRLFLTDNSLNILFSAAESSPLALEKAPKGSSFLIGAFLNDVGRQDPQVREIFTVIAKGFLLANSIYLNEQGRVGQKFRDTKVFFDSTFIIFAAGYAGPHRQAPCIELISLLRDYGGVLACFRDTVDEINAVLNACASRVREGNQKTFHGPTIEWFIESGKSASDIELMIARLNSKLRNLGIGIEDRPDRADKYQIGEKQLEELLQSGIGYRNPKALRHDINCISAISQLRKGKLSYDIETCGAIFVTTNIELARIARLHYQREEPEGSISLCITDYSLGNILWLKNPLKAPDLPFQLLIADALAALQPSEDLWKSYLAEVSRLKDNGDLSDEEYYALRYSLTAKRTLMDLTSGDISSFSEGTVSEILRAAKEKMRADLVDQLEEEKKRRNQAETKLLDANEARISTQQIVENKADKLAGTLSTILCIILLIVLLYGAARTFPWTFPAIKSSLIRYLTAAAIILFFIYTAISVFWGISIFSIRKGIKTAIRCQGPSYSPPPGSGGFPTPGSL